MSDSPGRLIVVRHGESEFNATGTWTGITDVGLTPKGHDDACRMGELLRDVRLDRVYTSCLRRSAQTRQALLACHGGVPSVSRKTAALNERDYGDYTGLDKARIKALVGAGEFTHLRRGFDSVIPNGESLRDVSERVVPWYLGSVLPALLAGENVLLVGHGNSCRALRKYVEAVGDEAVVDLEMDFDKVYLYRVEADGRMRGAAEIRTLPTLT